MQNDIHRVYGKKGEREMKNTPTADTSNPPPTERQQVQELGEERSRTKEEF